jgi:uncharacterized protein YcfJ
MSLIPKGEKRMKKSFLAAGVAAILAGTAVPAAAQQSYGDVARVISATPIYDRYTVPRRECRTEPVETYEERRSVRPGPVEYRPARNEGIGAGTVLGAIVGGVIGHQFGGTTGARDKATGAGAIIGGLIGNSVEREADAGSYDPASRDVYVERVPVTRDVQRCRDFPESRERIVACRSIRARRCR